MRFFLVKDFNLFTCSCQCRTGKDIINPHPVLYNSACQALEVLAAGEKPLEAVLRFELAILREIGQMPVFDSCAACGKQVEIDDSFAYWVSQSGLLCRNCQKEEFSQHQITAGTVAVLSRLTSGSADSVSRLVISPPQIREIRRITAAALTDILGRRPGMLRYLTGAG